MQLETRRIEMIIHYWVHLEEMKQREKQILARNIALDAARPSYDHYLRNPEQHLKRPAA